MKFTKKDLVFSIITGLTTGVIAYLVTRFNGVESLYGLPPIFLVMIVPIFWILGVNLGYFLGRWIGFFNQLGKFVAIGFTNFSVDTGFLYLLIYLLYLPEGREFALFKAAAISVAMFHSYIWNKFWVFGSGNSSKNGSEALRFFLVSISALVINSSVAYAVYNYISPITETLKAWAGISSVVGSAVALIFSFIGYKILVFAKSK